MASKTNVKRIKGIQFSLSNPADILKYSVCEVSTLDLYEKNEPNFNSLFDTRMGIVDTKYKCSTCEHPIQTCPGHFGHINLVRKVYVPHYLKTIVRLLQIVCTSCSKILKEDPVNAKKNAVKFNTFYNNTKEKTLCVHCGEIQPKISRDNITVYFSNVNNGGNSKEKIILTAEECYNILEMISDEDCIKLGFNVELSRPEWMIFSVVPVGPPCIRPSVFHDGGTRSECDLTYKYIDIIKCNTALKVELDRRTHDIAKKREELNLGEDETNDEFDAFIVKRDKIIEDRFNHLQIHVITVMNNKLTNVPISQNRSNRPFKCFTDKIVSKHGRIRGNLMGKRVDYSARSVITPDPMISIDELGVPVEMAMKLSINELVNKYNFEKLQKMVDNGPSIHPGALFITKNDKKISLHVVEKQIAALTEKGILTEAEEKRLKYFKEMRIIEHGDYVERHIANGDYVLFNRQPSLHKMSMMAHRVKVLLGQTFRLNPNVCTPYNADFDGDEMNMHVPRSIQSSIELSEIVAIPHQIVSPQSNKPVIGCIQDTLLGCKKITAGDVRISRSDIMDLLGYVPGNYSIPEDKPYWTGRELISLFLPNMNYRNGEVIIKNGQLIAGQMVKKHMGTSAGSLIHVIWNDYGPIKTMEFINNVQTIVNRWLMTQGISVGLSDTIADVSTLTEINNIVEQSQLEVYQEIAKYEHKKYAAQNADDIRQEFESKVVNMLNATRDSTGSLASKNVFSNNRINDMVTAGSKGSNLNISQIMANVGQQVVKTDGHSGRVENGLIDRPLPHMAKFDISPHARGFVSSSYLQGLGPVEFFYHSMSGREGLIDTAVKTSETGYLQRKLMKSLEDIKIGYGNYVQNASGQIIQFLYGGDVMDGAYLEKQTLQLCTLDNDQFQKTYIFSEGEIEKQMIKSCCPTDPLFQDKFIAKLMGYRKELHLNDYKEFVHVPFNIDRIIENTRGSSTKKLQYSYDFIVEQLEKLIDSLTVNQILGCIKEFYIKKCQWAIYSKLSPKQVINYRFTKKQFLDILSQIREKYTRAIIQPGEMVGAITAQSIGESLTQLTLNSFHSAGISSKTQITSGIPRFRELINVSRKPFNPSVEIYMADRYRKNEDHVSVLLEQLQYTELEFFLNKINIFYDVDTNNTTTGNHEIYTRNNKWFKAETGNSPWVMVLSLDASKIYKKKIYMSDFYKSLVSVCANKKIDILCGGDNDESLEIHLRCSDHTETNYNDLYSFALEIPKLFICGLKSVSESYTREVKNNVLDDNGRIVRESEFIIDTIGGSLADILVLPFVNPYKTVSTNIYDTFFTLGMEATRELLYREIQKLLASNGIYINSRHIEVLVDLITHRVFLMSMDRHGIKKADIGPLTRASFEESVEQLAKAAIFSQYDALDGVTPNIMIGQIGTFGTGISEVVVDTRILKKN